MSTHDPFTRRDEHGPGGRGNGHASMRWGHSTLEAGAATGSRSMAQLLRELSVESGNLVRQEVDLAKAEMREKMAVFQQSMVSIGIGSALLLGALLFGLWALNTGMTALLEQFMDLEIAVWLSPLILAVVFGAIGWGMFKSGKETMTREGLAPRVTRETLREDTRWARSKAREVKEEIIHGR